MIEFDIETRHLQTFWDEGAGVHLAQFYSPGLPEMQDPQVLRVGEDDKQIQAFLEQPDGYRGWNTKFDLHGLRNAGFVLPDDSLWHDGMVQAHLVDERSSVALKIRGEKLFGPEASDAQGQVHDWLKTEDKRRQKASKASGDEFKRANYGDVPFEIMGPYAAGDVLLTDQVGGVYEPVLEQNAELGALYEIERANLRASFWMEDRGIPVDREAMVAHEAYLLPLLDSQEDVCRRIAGFKNFNPRSWQQIGVALDRLDADTRFMARDADTGALKTDEENLSACDHPLAEAILRYRGIHKMWAMLRGIVHGPVGRDADKFPHPYLSREDRLHPNFRQTGARTGRYSCSNPNFQQIPRDNLDMRYAIAARDGKRLVTADLDSIELVLLAAFAGKGAMRDALLRGDDPHAATAKMANLTGRRRADGNYESPRDQGKRMNYLQVYGGGVTAVRKWFHVSQAEARAIIHRYEQAYPEIAALQSRVDYALADKGYVKTPFGRRQRAWSRRNAHRESYKFVNYLIQGTAADMMKIAIQRVHEAGVPLVATVHDELIAEVDEGDAEEAGRIMEHALTDFPEIAKMAPLKAEPQVVQRWSQAKKAEFKPVYMP